MPLPPTGDPRRPLHLAIRSMRLLGGLFVLLGLCAVMPALLVRGGMATSVFTAFAGLVYGVPGALYIVCCVYLARHKAWAVTLGIVLASLQILVAVVGASAAFVAMFRPGAGMGGTPSVVPVVFMLFVLAALAQLIYHLARSYAALHLPPVGADVRGFEPLGVGPYAGPYVPVQPAAPPGGAVPSPAAPLPVAVPPTPPLTSPLQSHPHAPTPLLQPVRAPPRPPEG